MNVDKNYLVSYAFDNNNRQFIIPVYQRNYDWGVDNCSILFDDVISSIQQEHSHFLGTFVLSAQEGSTQGITTYVIIDGQQRLTTVYLFLKALQDLSEDERHQSTISELLFNNPKHFKVEDRMKYKLKLKAVKTDQEQLEKLMDNNFDEMDKKSNIWINYSFFKKAISAEMKNSNLTIGDFLRGLDRLEIVVISLQEPNDDPQVVFERINSTGLDLNLSDLVRNYLLMTDADMDNLFEQYWSPMEELVGKDEVKNYILIYLIFKIPDFTDKNAYKTFKRYVSQNNLSHEEILKEIKKYAKYYALFIGKNTSNYSPKIVETVQDFQLIRHTTIFPLLFSIFSDFDDGIIDENTLLDVLNFLISYLVRRTIVGIPTNSLRGFFKTIYRRIFPDGCPNQDNYLESFYNTFISLTGSTRDGLQSDQNVKNALLNNDLYSVNKSYFCKYLLSSLENKSGNKNEHVAIDENITIEHILPQTPTQWWDEEEKKNPSVYDTHLHRLGNLSLTGVNSELGNEEFYEKKVAYEKTKYTFLYLDVIDKEHWTLSEIEERGERLANRIIEIFPLPEGTKFNLTSSETFSPSNDFRLSHSIAEQIDYSNKKPSSIVFEGMYYPVGHMKDILEIVCSQLYLEDPEKFTNLVLNKEEGKKDSKGFWWLSFNSDDFLSPLEIDDIGIFIETKQSNASIIGCIRKILYSFHIDYDELVISIKDDADA